MATPLTPDQFVKALRAEGVRVVEVADWRTHNRNHKGAWGPVHGVMVHHTAGGSDGAVDFCYDGSSDLPGPLCHGVITKDGTVHVISAGRSNHAGGGDPNVLAAVKDERYGDYPPATHQHQGTAGAVDGNAHFYGWECVNLGNGKDPWPAVQVEAIVRASAAVCRAYGWSAKSVIGHREWSDYKPDPSGPGMPNGKDLRARIQERLDHAPTWGGEPDPAHQTRTPMADPQLSILVRTEDYALTLNSPQRLYWTTEYTDEPGEHPAAGKTVLNGGRYTASVSLTVTGLAAGDTVEVYPVEEDASGTFAGSGKPFTIVGTGAAQTTTATFVGRVWNLLSFEVVARSTGVSVTDATLAMLSWPTA